MLSRLVLLAFSVAAASAQPVLMPLPASLQTGTGALPIDGSFRIQYVKRPAPRLDRAGRRFLEQLTKETAIPLNTPPGKPTLFIDCAQTTDRPLDKLGDPEAYRLEITTTQARLTSATILGTMRGLQTFLQLVEPSTKGFAAPAVTIDDSPRYPWRGLLIDVTSHFMPVPVILRTLDTMEAVKLNVFHWHLTDDQGFRVESKLFPKLHQLGTENGEYYSQDEIRRIISYARDRGIRIIPEFDMPGHCATWLIGYPELASAPGPYSIIHTFGIYDPTLDATNEAVYAFIDKLMGEMTTLFPDEYLHIGGDEVTYKHWQANPKIQAFIKQRNLVDEKGLQAYFNRRVLEILRKHNRKVAGWDEILHQKLPKDIMVQSWQNHTSLAAAAKEGYKTLLSFGYYLDHLNLTSTYYHVDPLGGPASSLTPEEARNVLGGEACMWTEFISPLTIDSRMWPKSAAVAERLWSPAALTTSTESMYQRLDRITHRLDYRGATHNTNYDAMLRRIAPTAPIETMRTLADALDPQGIEVRELFQKYAQDTQLNRMVDAARGDSRMIRDVESLMGRYVAQPSPALTDQIRAELQKWYNVHQTLMPLYQSSYLLNEAQPLASDLQQIANIGFEAISRMQTPQPNNSTWARERLITLDTMAKPKLEVINAATRPVRLLVEALQK
ncbi:MAG: family 20 glycosylhydrolase [Bryobacteraceae bacterium]|nr:family 20 glycosylhydrolase [Bryobacteraceae bacterium]